MGTHNTVRWIVAILVVVTAAGSNSILANSVHVYSGDFSLPIPASDDPDAEYSKGWMEDAIIQVPDHFILDDIDVGFTLTHTSAFDLQIFLQSPAGTSLCLYMYNFSEYFEGENCTQTIFDDEAELPIEQGEPPFTGRFRPKTIDPFNSLGIFDGQDAFGPWRLRIYDAWYADTGTLSHFELIFSTPEPTTVILLILGIGLMRLHKCVGTSSKILDP